jgi:hypothetical protein
MLRVLMLSGDMLSVIKVFMLCVNMLSGIMHSVFILSVNMLSDAQCLHAKC